MSIYDGQSVAHPSDAEIIAHATQLRAEAVAKGLTRLAAWIARLAPDMLRWRQRMVANELNRLTDAQLADIGISRDDIACIAAGNPIDDRALRDRLVPRNSNDRRRIAA